MKLHVVEQLGETAVILPELVNRGLLANDRLKYYMTLLQAVVAHAAQPQQPPADFRAEREASGIAEMEFDQMVGRSRRQPDGLVSAPGIGQLRTLLLADLEAMLKPVDAEPLDSSTRSAAAFREPAARTTA
jgi:hypothetical protein